jgi:hypothetical protein
MKIYCLGPVAPRFSTISAATNATPIVLTLAAALGTGPNALNPAVDVLTVGGALVNTNANGSFAPGSYLVNTPTSITLLTQAGNGVYGGGGSASSPRQLIASPTFPVIPGVTDNTKVMVCRLLFTPVPFGTATLLVGAAGLNQATFANVFRPINPPPALGIYDYYDLATSGDLLPIADYWIDAVKPGTEAVLTSFWIR